jgi:protein SCO1/2
VARALSNQQRGTLGLALLAAVGLVTAAWWALALWPLGADAPGWVARTRWLCFGSPPHGLPNAGGWIALVGEPIAMTGLLLVVWGDAVRSGLRALRASAAGRLALAAAVMLTVGGVAAASVRVARATGGTPPDVTGAAAVRVDRPAPPLELPEQSGRPFSLALVRGRPVLVTFAFGHCETVCPVVVHDVREAARRAADRDPAIVVVSLDPWRDLPSRLPAIARAWELPDDAHVLTGSVDQVMAVLADWGMAISRDTTSGDITHPAVVYVIDRAGRIAFTAPGGAELLADLLERL